MEVVSLDHAWGSLLFAALLTLVTFLIARRAGYFRLPPASKALSVTFFHTLGIFLLYLLVSPLIVYGLIRLLNHGVVTIEWRIAALFVVFLSVLAYLLFMNKQARRYIFWGDGEVSVRRAGKSILMGLVSLAVSYPFVFLVSAVTSVIALLLWGDATVNQLAVKQLRMTIGHPLLFSLMVFLVVIVVPFVEELLFRGFLQSYLKRYLGRTWALLSTAVIFAAVHFAPSQGFGNFQLLCSLLVLAFFLGFIYERERCLWASVALHSAFNGVTVLLILL